MLVGLYIFFLLILDAEDMARSVKYHARMET